MRTANPARFQLLAALLCATLAAAQTAAQTGPQDQAQDRATAVLPGAAPKAEVIYGTVLLTPKVAPLGETGPDGSFHVFHTLGEEGELHFQHPDFLKFDLYWSKKSNDQPKSDTTDRRGNFRPGN